jgi:hypothetical protein
VAEAHPLPDLRTPAPAQTTAEVLQAQLVQLEAERAPLDVQGGFLPHRAGEPLNGPPIPSAAPIAADTASPLPHVP